MSSQLLARIASAAIVLMTVVAVALGAPLPTAKAAQTHAAPILREGAGLGAAPSAAVRRVQRILDRRGFDLGPAGVDGRFGPRTAAAVRRMQSRYGLVADGVVGAKTPRLVSLLARTSPRPRATRPQRPARTPRQTAPRATTQPKQQPQTQTQPQTTPAPAQPVRSAAAGDNTLPIALAALAAALAAGAFAVAAARTTRRPDAGTPLLAAIDRDLYVEGE